MATPARAAAARTGRGRPGKHEAIVRAARTVFGRDGYPRTTADAIAREAQVSTRTLYKHFGSKEQLFAFVLHDSAARVADAFIDRVERDLRGATGARQQLIALGRALVAHRVEFPEHFALVQMIGVEGRHFPPELLEAWRRAGPLRVRAEVVRRLRALADLGLLRVTDPDRAALHLTALVTFEVTNQVGHQHVTADEVEAMVTAGVRAFLDGYRAPGAA